MTAAIAGLLATLSLRLLRRARGLSLAAPVLLSLGIAILHFGALGETVLADIDAARVTGLSRAALRPLVVTGVLGVCAMLGALMALQAQGEGRARDLAALAQHTTDALASRDAHGRILWANGAFEATTGHGAAAVQGGASDRAAGALGYGRYGAPCGERGDPRRQALHRVADVQACRWHDLLGRGIHRPGSGRGDRACAQHLYPS